MRARRLLVSLVIVSGCAGSAQPQASTSNPQGTEASRQTSSAVTATSSPGGCSYNPDAPTRLHQAAELEALLPATVSGRSLAKWSLRGRCWLQAVVNRPAADIDADMAALDAEDKSSTIDLDHLALGVAGRSDTHNDPPYFVYGATRPHTNEEVGLALFLLFGGAQYHDLAHVADLSGFEERTLAGKVVYVGKDERLEQSDHQRGRPSAYQTDEYMFLVITDDEAWASDAISQLPG
jgi:hypothetical protein